MLWASSDLFAKIVVGAFLNLVLIQFLSPSDFGVVASVVIVTAIGNALTNSGFGTSLIRAKILNNQDLSTVFWINLGVSCLVYAIILLGTSLSLEFGISDKTIAVVRILSLSIVINAFKTVQVSRFTRQLAFKLMSKINITSMILGASIAILMAYVGLGVWSIVANSIISAVVSAVLMWIYSGWRPSFIYSKLAAREHFQFGYRLTIASLVDAVTSNIAATLLSVHGSMDTVGYYNQSKTFSSMPSVALTKLASKLVLPLYSKRQDQVHSLAALYFLFLEATMMTLFPIFLVIALLASRIFPLLFPVSWLLIIPYFQVLIVLSVFMITNTLQTQVFKALGRSDVFLKTTLIKKLGSIFLLLLGLKFQIWGIIVASCIIQVISFVVNAYYLAKLGGPPFMNYFGRFKRSSSVILLFSILSWLFSELINMGIYLDVIIIGLVNVILYLFICEMIQPFSYTRVRKFLLFKYREWTV